MKPPSSSSSSTTIENNDTLNDNSVTQNITINDIIQALTIIKNGNSTENSVLCPPNSGSTTSNDVNSGKPLIRTKYMKVCGVVFLLNQCRIRNHLNKLIFLGSLLTTPSSFYEPPPMDGNNESNKDVENSATHDSNTDDIHLTTAFPTPSTISSSTSGSDGGQNTLLPPVEIPPQITDEDIKIDDNSNSANANIMQENINIDSLTGKAVSKLD